MFHAFAASSLCALVLSVPVAPLSPQQAPKEEPATALIVGTIVDGSSGKPIGNVTVSLSGTGLVGRPPSQQTPAIVTGADGRFVFTGLGAGRYALSTQKPGYLPAALSPSRPGAGGASVDLAAGERRTDLMLYAWKTAAIGGTVIDEAGEPTPNIEVRFLKRSVSAGRVVWSPAGISTVRTDDRGIYRVADVTPGDWVAYILVTQTTMPTSVTEEYEKGLAARSPTFSQLMSEMVGGSGVMVSPPGNSGVKQAGDLIASSPEGTMLPHLATTFAYSTTFYPAATSVSTATAITLGSGEERFDINFQLRPVRTIRVSGTLLGPDGPLGLTRVAIVPRGTSPMSIDLEVAATVSDPSGAFTLLNVPEGQYTLRVLKVPRAVNNTPTVTSVVQSGSGAMTMTSTSGPSPSAPLPKEPVLWASEPLSAGNEDISRLVVTTRPGLKVGGRVEFLGSAPKPDEKQMPLTTVRLTPADGRTQALIASSIASRVSATGEVVTQGFAPGRYFVTAAPPGATPGWTLESIMHDGVDVSQVPLELTSSDVSDLVFTFTDRKTEIAGALRNGNGEPEASALVIAFPADATPTAEEPTNPRRVRAVRTMASGKFQLNGLPPGDYFVAVVPTALEERYADPQVLQSLRAQAVRARATYGQVVTASLTLPRGR